jgi:hypothetical protein
MRCESVWLFLLLCIFYSNAQTVESDSVYPDITTPSIKESVAWREDSLHRTNPFVSGTASMIVPGAGQILTGHYVMAGFIIALEAIFAGQANYWSATAKIRDQNANYDYSMNMRNWSVSDTATRSRLDSATIKEQYMVDRHGALECRFSSYNFAVWAVGAYIYNILDAVNSSNFFKNSSPKNPGTAAWLAAVPGLGLGQLYNGSVSKAGMVIMGQFSLGVMAYNSHRLMIDAENNYLRINGPNADSLTKVVATTFSGNWSGLQYRAFTNRNMYLWYSIFFYFYSIFDATVDAYLHDYPQKMKIEPDLGVSEKEIRFSLSTTF